MNNTKYKFQLGLILGVICCLALLSVAAISRTTSVFKSIAIKDATAEVGKALTVMDSDGNIGYSNLTATVTNAIENSSGFGTNTTLITPGLTEASIGGAVYTGTHNYPTFDINSVAIFDSDGNLSTHPNVSTDELAYLNGVTSAIQTQFGLTITNFTIDRIATTNLTNNLTAAIVDRVLKMTNYSATNYFGPTVTAGSNVTVTPTTNAFGHITFEVASTGGGGSGIPTLNGDGTNTTLYATADGNPAVLSDFRQLNNSDNLMTLTWEGTALVDPAAGGASYVWNTGSMRANDGTTETLNHYDRTLTGDWTLNGSTVVTTNDVYTNLISVTDAPYKEQTLVTNGGTLIISNAVTEFTKYSSTTFTLDASTEWVTFAHWTNNIIAGRLLIYGQDATNGMPFAVELHIDGVLDVSLSGDSTTNAPVYCQFQGVIPMADLIRMEASTDGVGAVKLRIKSEQVLEYPITVTVDAYGVFMPEVSATETNGSALDVSNEFIPINQNIAANQFVAKKFSVLFADGSVNDLIEEGGNGIEVGTTSFIDILAVNRVFRLASPEVPATASSAGTTGDIAWDAEYIYVCIAANTWVRAELLTW